MAEASAWFLSAWTPLANPIIQELSLIHISIAPFVDVMIGNEEDFQASLGLSIEGSTEDFSLSLIHI